MTETELLKLIDHEINWLNYYGLREDREKLTIDSDIYRDVRSIGYTKRVIPLITRCSPGLITSKNTICESTTLEELESCYFPKMENCYTPLEIWFILYPDRKSEMILKLIPKPLINETRIQST